MCSPRRINVPQRKGYILWILEAERQRKEKELKLLTYFAVGVAIVPLVFIVCALLYVLIK
jgi:hypothetical protein|nr:MAG TPA: protein of unknown function (DUF3333) [Caudoviricetes sp.]DAM60024.1 MAG TPA: protein of unknown function (DUF3333) [Caudoviricetes sp.]DAQ54445.1 MAG TPA: protein of unknown function (DUF3333) [Caudoviricetes sp.]DAU72387.1 MAG TPA: protein of unknown function (DUF3333) [Caudoviricetes sp.]